MTNKNQELEHYNNNIFGVFVGVLVGGLAGALTMLLMAPQSGEETRTQIQEKGVELRDQTTGMLEDAIAQMRKDSKKMTQTGREKAKELLEQGQALVIEQLDHVSDAAKAGKKAVENA